MLPGGEDRDKEQKGGSELWCNVSTWTAAGERSSSRFVTRLVMLPGGLGARTGYIYQGGETGTRGGRVRFWCTVSTRLVMLPGRAGGARTGRTERQQWQEGRSGSWCAIGAQAAAGKGTGDVSA